MDLILGIDGGGTQTRALLATAAGDLLGRGSGPASNPRAVGLEAAVAAIGQAVAAAFASAGLGPPDGPVAAACLGMAGVGRPGDRRELEGRLAEGGLARRSLIVTDAEPVLAAGTPAGWGVALISGTGSVGYARDLAGRVAQVGGWGYLLGDEGSGYALAQAGLRLATQTADGRAAAHSLLRAILEHWGLAEPADLIGHVYGGALGRPALADLARPIVALAEAGDPDAAQLLEEGAAQLALIARTAAGRLQLEGPPTATAGGLLGASPLLRARLAARLGPGWGPISHVDDPARGTLVIARRLLEP